MIDRMKEEEESLVLELKQQLDDEKLNLEQRLCLLNAGLHNVLNSASVPLNHEDLKRVKSRLYLSGILSHCVLALSHPRMHRGVWSAAATLAQLTSSCCVGLDPRRHSDALLRLFLPSVVDGLLSLAAGLARRAEAPPLRTVMDALGRLLSAHTQLTAQVLSSAHYELIQMSEDAAVSLLCVQLWTRLSSSRGDFLSGLGRDSALLLLNEAVGQLALSSNSAVGEASVRLILLMANQLGLRLHALLLNFRGLDSLLDKDWRGRGFDQEVDQLIGIIQSEKGVMSPSQVRTVRAACVIQASWRSYQTRRRVKSLSRAVSALQRTYRARRRQQEQQKEAQQWEEELKYQVSVRRQRARTEFHQKQRRLLQLLPPDQVQSFLQECERCAAVVIQSHWRGFRERHNYNNTLRHTQRETRAVRTLQRQVRHFLQRRRAEKAPPPTPSCIGRAGLTDSRRAELQQEVEENLALHPSSLVSPEECRRLHEEVQLLLEEEVQGGGAQRRRREEQRVEALLAHTHTQLELLRDAPPLSVVTVTMADSFLRPSGPVAARARDAHNAALQAGRRPFWGTLHETDGCGPAHFFQDLEAELGGLYLGGL